MGVKSFAKGAWNNVVARPAKAAFRPVADQFTDWRHTSTIRKDGDEFARMVRDTTHADLKVAREIQFAQVRSDLLSGNNAAMKGIVEQEVAASLHAAHAGQSLGSRLGRDGVFKTVGNKIKGVGKKGMIGAGIVAGLAGLGIMAASWRRDRARNSEQEARDVQEAQAEPVPQVMSGDMMSQPQTMMGMQPAPGEHAARVMAGRGMVPQMGPVNPAMSVVPEESVAPLGNTRA